MKLNEIRDNEGAHKKRMRVGRGPGSGKGCRKPDQLPRWWHSG